MQKLTPEQIDHHLDQILKASGSRLANYEFYKTIEDMREAVRAVVEAASPSDTVTIKKSELQEMLNNVSIVMSEAYNRASEECCGNAQYECCGNSVQVWSDEDNQIMDMLQPVQNSLACFLDGEK